MTSVPTTADESAVSVTVSVSLVPAATSNVHVPSGAVVSTNVPLLATTESRVTPTAANVRSSSIVTPVASEGP